MNDYLMFLNEIKNSKGFKYIRLVLGIGENADVLAKAVSGDLKIEIINAEDLLLYKTDEVLIVTDNFDNIAKKYSDFGYLVKEMKRE